MASGGKQFPRYKAGSIPSRVGAVFSSNTSNIKGKTIFKWNFVSREKAVQRTGPDGSIYFVTGNIDHVRFSKRLLDFNDDHNAWQNSGKVGPQPVKPTPILLSARRREVQAMAAQASEESEPLAKATPRDFLTEVGGAVVKRLPEDVVETSNRIGKAFGSALNVPLASLKSLLQFRKGPEKVKETFKENV